METNQKTGSARAVEVFSSQGLQDTARVERIKALASLLWDEIDGISGSNYPYFPAERLAATAKTQLEGAVMWAVKAISRSRS